jgi:uncharacterized protein
VRVYVDTSALYALVIADDPEHARVVDAFAELRSVGATLMTTSYVLVETTALLRARSGLEAVRTFHDDVRPILDTVWVDADLHARGVDALLAADRRSVSLVDWVGFISMRDSGIERALAVGDDSADLGFDIVP